MSMAPSRGLVNARDHAALTRAALLLEQTSFAIKVADLVGRPVTRVFGMLPGFADRQVAGVIEAAMLKSLSIAIDSLEGTPPSRPSRWVPRLTTGVTGGLGGLFGALALPIELPLTTTLMLQSIADIARHQGEDLARPEARLSCLEVFALGDRRSGKRADIAYYATRSVLAQLTADLAALIIQRRMVDTTSPVAIRLVREIAGRFGIAVSERAAASALPIIGAVGGATVNMMFMSHFQQIAEGHFTIRRLERRYGDEAVRNLYRSIVAEPGGRAIA
jgi:EcsC protein family